MINVLFLLKVKRQTYYLTVCFFYYYKHKKKDRLIYFDISKTSQDYYYILHSHFQFLFIYNVMTTYIYFHMKCIDTVKH